MDVIRKIKDTDYLLLTYLWSAIGEVVSSQTIYPKESTYVFERNGHMLYCVGLYLVKGVPIAFAEGLIHNTGLKADPKAVKQLQAHIEKEAKSVGCKMLLAISRNDVLTKHHARLGYNKVSTGALMVKGL